MRNSIFDMIAQFFLKKIVFGLEILYLISLLWRGGKIDYDNLKEQ
jgi:hypothetical protein